MICIAVRLRPYSSSSLVSSLPISPSTIASRYDTSSANGPSDSSNSISIIVVVSNSISVIVVGALPKTTRKGR